MNDFSVAMALADYIPVAFFAAAGIVLMCDLYNKMRGAAFALFAAGVINVTLAGALKATWKLFYAANVCDFAALNAMFFPVQSIGFLLAGIGSLLLLRPQAKNAALAVAPPVFTGTFVFVGLMVAGLGMMDTVLCILAARLKKRRLIAVFAVSFLCSLCMGYLSGKDFAQASMNWIAEGVNVLGQGLLLLGAVLLHKAGLKEMELKNGREA